MDIKLFYLYRSWNWYSFASLIGSLEQVPWFSVLDVHRLAPSTTPLTVNASHSPKIIAHSFSTPNLPNITEEISLLRKKHKQNTFFIAGGSHPSGDPHGTLKLGFDGVLVGEGEQSFIDLLYTIKEGIPLDAAEIPGLLLAEDSHDTEPTLPPPIDLDRYPSFSKMEHLYPPIEITRGCPYSCSYCQVPRLHSKMRHRSLSRVIEIVHAYRDVFRKKRRQPTDIRFITPNALTFANSHPQKGFEAIEQLLKDISSLPQTQVFFASFPSEIRPEYLTEEAALIIQKYAANREIIIGGQSASDELLKSIQRGHTADTIEEAVDIALHYHLKPLVDFILGLPPETPEDQAQTMQLIETLIKKGAVPRIHHFIPLAGTPYYTIPPAPVALTHRKRIGELMRTGKVKGAFEHQRTIAYRIVNYIRRTENLGN
ncbi:MAG: TIGR04013 family B12-binding domain/radical SAM domain-containing protein [Candidatus Heimdallarchaeota archaeon]